MKDELIQAVIRAKNSELSKYQLEYLVMRLSNALENEESDNARLREHSEFLEWQIANMVAFMEEKYPWEAAMLETACGANEVLEKCARDRKENE